MLNVPSVQPAAVVVAMPTYNHARFVSEAVESIIGQTFQAWELLVIDDGSTDETLKIVRRFQDPRVRVITRERQGLPGLGDLYQMILKESVAPLVAILEGDDRWPPDKLERQVPDFNDPTVVLSYGSGLLIDECGCEYGRVTPFKPGVRVNRPVGSIVPGLLVTNAILSPTVVVRRATLDAVGGFWQPEGVPYVDHPTWLLLAMKGSFAYHDKAVGSWRRHPAQWTTLRVRSDVGLAPEDAYVGLIAERFRTHVGADTPPGRTLEMLRRRHSDRATTNRWRLALLVANPREIATLAIDLIRSRRLRNIGIAILGLVLWGLGSDLEWIQLRRGRVGWPSRRHAHTQPCSASALGDANT